MPGGQGQIVQGDLAAAENAPGAAVAKPFGESVLGIVDEHRVGALQADHIAVGGVGPAHHFDCGAGPAQNFSHGPGAIGDHRQAQNVGLPAFDLFDGFVQ